MNYSLILINTASACKRSDINSADKFLLQKTNFDPPALELREIFNLLKTAKTSKAVDKTQDRKN